MIFLPLPGPHAPAEVHHFCATVPPRQIQRKEREENVCVCVKGGEPIQRGGVHATLPQNYDNSRRNQRTVERERENEKTTPQWSKK